MESLNSCWLLVTIYMPLANVLSSLYSTRAHDKSPDDISIASLPRGLVACGRTGGAALARAHEASFIIRRWLPGWVDRPYDDIERNGSAFDFVSSAAIHIARETLTAPHQLSQEDTRLPELSRSHAAFAGQMLLHHFRHGHRLMANGPDRFNDIAHRLQLAMCQGLLHLHPLFPLL